MDSSAAIARAVAGAFLAGDQEVDKLVDRAERTLGKRWRWLRPLACRYAARFGNRTRPRQAAVTQFILSDRGYQRACEKHELRLREVLLAAPAAMSPIPRAQSWPVPSLRTVGELADWLGIATRQLDWFADIRLLESSWNRGRLRNYRYRPLSKRFGNIRLIESPKCRLKRIQRRVLAEILNNIPPHDAAHGFRPGRSIATFADPHVGKRIVIRIDLQDFFPTIRLAQVQALFRTVGYPEEVADLLAGLCTNATPSDVWQLPGLRSGEPDWGLQRSRWLYARPHLPQGAPTSPALANLCAYRLDCRLRGLAQAAGGNYTRYADDLAFSGQRDFERVAQRFPLHVSATVMEEGFRVHHRKTRIMRRGVRQRLAGLVVNERLNVSRYEYDRLKATLTNCIRHGAHRQNHGGHRDFRSHLEGRLSFVEMVNPDRGRRLRKLFDQIEWQAPREERGLR